MPKTISNSRNAVRASTNHLSTLEWRRGKASARVLDISMTGARLATHADVLVGAEVKLTTVRMGTRPARITRVEDGEVALKFIDDLALKIEGRPAF